ncbi:hypothetical protein [Paenibacillus glucanolyticus]|uniref:hypothetical protein n=1 Tax=Paenibacillus glucanolyticus TaxID=59843 RepID=UPI0034CFCD2B
MNSTEVPGDQYRDLFLSQHTHPFIMVNQEVWELAISRLPKDYFIPDYRIINMMMNMV